jgi:hypothetical protein
MSNFEVGDVVINLNQLHLWNNTYYANRFISAMRETVTAVNGDLFTTDRKQSLSEPFSDKSMDAQRIFRQEDGRCIADSSSFRYNLTKHPESILYRVNAYFDAGYEKFKADDKEAINDIENQIAVLQQKLNDIYSGNRPLTSKQTVREHHDECVKAVMAQLKI